jgi:uncharacterized phage-associated protein
MPAAVQSAFDVAFWFTDQALQSNEYLQPQKLQRLMFLAQCYYAVAFPNRKLMPAVFVADELGPLEPNVFRAFSRGRPNVDADLFMPPEVEEFLYSIWRRFGHHTVDHLNRITKKTLAYRQAFKMSPREEISLQQMRLSFARAESTPPADKVVGPKVMRSQSGKPVTVKSWTPGGAKK